MRTPHDEDMARRYVQVSASAPAELGTLTVQSAAGTAVGATKLTVTPALTSGNSYKYKVSMKRLQLKLDRMFVFGSLGTVSQIS